MFVRRVGARIANEPPEDGFYFVINRQCYKLTGDFIEKFYNAFIDGQKAYNKFRGTLKTIAPQYNCGAYYATRIWSCINKIFIPDYYEDISNANWLIEMISKTPAISLELMDVGVDYPTGYKDKEGTPLYENDLVTDSEGCLWKIIITPNLDVCLKEVDNSFIRPLKSDVTSSLIRKEF